MTFIDDAGKTCLAAMYRQGAEFVAADCLTKDIVAEIRQRRSEQQNSFLFRETAAGDTTT